MQAQQLTLGDGVPATFMAAGPGAPLIVFSNGFGAPRAQAVPPGVPENRISPPLVLGLLEAGYSVLAPENPGHGDRLANGDTTSDALTRSFLGDGPDLVRLTVDETPAIVDSAVEHGLVSSPDRIAVLGHSWGAYQSLLRLAGDERIACAVALIPVIDPRCLDPFAALPRGIRLDERSLIDLTVEQLRSRPLLVIASSDDDVAPAGYARELVETLCATAATGDRVDYVELDGVGHHFDQRQLDAIMLWLQSRLPTRRSARA